MRTILFCTLITALLLSPSAPAALAKDDDPKGKRAARGPVTDAERDEAILKGIRYLDDTVLGLPDAQGTPTKQFTVAVTGLVKLLAADKGSSSSGKRANLERIRAYLERYVARIADGVKDPSRLPTTQGQFSSDRLIQYTWPVAMTGVFFGELHARGKHTGQAKRVLKQVRTILRAAQRENGGWGHHATNPGGRAAPRGLGGMAAMGGGYPDTLLCTSWVVTSALGLLEGTPGSSLPPHLAKALDYLRDAQLDNGNYPYDETQRSAHRSLTGVSRAAGAAFALWTLGVPWRDKTMKRSLDFIDEHFDYLNEGHGSSTLNLMYGALLQKLRGTKPWKRFKQRYFRPIVAGQAEDGSFACICEAKAFGATNDTDPFGSMGKAGKGVVKQAGDMGLLKKFTQGTKTAYVSSIHVLILLLDRTQPTLLDGKRPKIPSGSSAPTTPR